MIVTHEICPNVNDQHEKSNVKEKQKHRRKSKKQTKQNKTEETSMLSSLLHFGLPREGEMGKWVREKEIL